MAIWGWSFIEKSVLFLHSWAVRFISHKTYMCAQPSSPSLICPLKSITKLFPSSTTFFPVSEPPAKLTAFKIPGLD